MWYPRWRGLGIFYRMYWMHRTFIRLVQLAKLKKVGNLATGKILDRSRNNTCAYKRYQYFGLLSLLALTKNPFILLFHRRHWLYLAGFRSDSHGTICRQMLPIAFCETPTVLSQWYAMGHRIFTTALSEEVSLSATRMVNQSFPPTWRLLIFWRRI